ncbi:MAG: phosphoglycerate dehydrogenase, partial [Deltaproteobacteria bacterium]|nr:phosphoglycerate dehydrogenase [Deltaproteobacteria bacterium]
MKVLIVASGFVQQSRRPIEILEEAGFTVEEREYGLAGLNQNEEEFCRIIKGADALVVTGMDRVTRRVMASADRLKMIAIRSSGFEGTDLKAAAECGIAVTHNPGANKEPVADLAVGLMIAVIRKMPWMDRGMREGKYNEIRPQVKDIFQKTLGIIGLGRIGKTVARRVKGFDMKILYHDIVAYDDFAREHGIRKVPLEELLQESDVITLHVPLDGTTAKMIGPKEIRRMKADAILVNTCRGPVVDEEALLAALKSGHLYGYGTDVYTQEPPQNLELVRMDNVISTPHVGGITEGGLMGLAMATVT